MQRGPLCLQEVAYKELKDAQKAVDDTQKSWNALDADIAVKELEVVGLKKTQASTATLLDQQKAIRDEKANYYRQLGGSSST